MNQPSCSHTANVAEHDSNDTVPVYMYEPHCNKPRHNLNGAQCFKLTTDTNEKGCLVFRWRLDILNVLEVIWSIPIIIGWGKIPYYSTHYDNVSTPFFSIADVEALNDNCEQLSEVMNGYLESIKINTFTIEHDLFTNGVVFINNSSGLLRVLPRPGCIRLLERLDAILVSCHRGHKRMLRYLNEQANDTTTESESDSE